MKKNIKNVKWQWLILMGICMVIFVVSLPIGIKQGVGYDLYGQQLPNWWMLATILSLGFGFISGFLFLKEIYL